MTGVGGFRGAPLLVGAVLFIVAFLSVIIEIIGIISDLIRTNRIGCGSAGVTC